MTKKELSQLYWLNREIEEEKHKLEELTAASEGCTQSITGLPHVNSAGACLLYTSPSPRD